jgi:hypothetical protein
MWVSEVEQHKRQSAKQLKISPLAMVPHKSWPFWSILDLLFAINLSPTELFPSINSQTTKSVPAGAINQLGHSFLHIIHAFAMANKDDKIYMAKWDINSLTPIRVWAGTKNFHSVAFLQWE